MSSVTTFLEYWYCAVDSFLEEMRPFAERAMNGSGPVLGSIIVTSMVTKRFWKSRRNYSRPRRVCCYPLRQHYCPYNSLSISFENMLLVILGLPGIGSGSYEPGKRSLAVGPWYSNILRLATVLYSVHAHTLCVGSDKLTQLSIRTQCAIIARFV